MSHCPSHPISPWDEIDGLESCQSVPFAILSIPSHFTMGRNRRTGIIPKCPICYTVYPIPGLNGRSGTVPKCPICVHCPSHLTVPWEGMDGLGSYQSVPFATPCPHCPSHPTVNGQMKVVPKCRNCYALSGLSISHSCTMKKEHQITHW